MLARSKMSREGAKALGIHKSLPDHTPKKPGLLKRGAELVNTFRSKVKKWGDEGLAKHKEKQQDRLQTAKTKAMGREGKREPGMFSKLAGAAKRVIGRVGDHVAASARARAPRLTHMAIGKEKSGEAEARKVRQSALAKKELGVGSSPKISGRAGSKGKSSPPRPRITTQAQRAQSKEAGGAGKVKIELPRSYAQGMSNNSSSANQKSKARARGKVKAAMAGGA